MIPIGVAPRTNDSTLTLVAREEHWDQLIKLLSADYSTQKIRIALLRQRLKEGDGRRITLPIAEARAVLRLCGISY